MQRDKKDIKKTKLFLRRYFFYFVIFSLIGPLIEWSFYFGKGILYDQGIYHLFGIKLAFIPFYGLGGLILIILDQFLEAKKIKFIYWGLLNGVFSVLWELIGGLFTLFVFNERFWDYSNQSFNFRGIISLRMFLVWTLMGYFFSVIYRGIISKNFKTKHKIS